MAKDSQELRVAAYGSIYVAEYGATLPTAGDDPTASLDGAFVELGYANEDGATLSTSPEVEDFRGWQSAEILRREVTQRDSSLSFTLLQWNVHTVPFAFGGGTIEDHGSGIYSYTPPAGQDALDERSLVLDWNDGDANYRIVVPRGNVTEETETQLQRAALAELPITFGVLAPSEGVSPWYILSDDPNFAHGS